MHDVHGKEINLQRSTVKVPGLRPATATATDGIKPSKSASSADIRQYTSLDSGQNDGSAEGIVGELAVAAAAMALQRSLERDMSTYDRSSSRKVWGHETEGSSSPPDGSTPRLLSVRKRNSDHSLPPVRDSDSPHQAATLPRTDRTTIDDLDGRKRSGSSENVSASSSRSSTLSRSGHHRDSSSGTLPSSGTHKKGHRRRRSWGAAKSLEDGLFVSVSITWASQCCTL